MSQITKPSHVTPDRRRARGAAFAASGTVMLGGLDAASVDLTRLGQPDPTDTARARETRTVEGLPAGERALREAVLLDAIEILRKHAEQARRNWPEERNTGWRRQYAEARRWMAADDHGQPFSFVRVCEALGLDPEIVRAHVLRAAPVLPPDPSPGLAQGERLIAWARQQVAPWTVADVADALRCDIDVARGLVVWLIRQGRVESYRAARSRQAGLYRVRRAA